MKARTRNFLKFNGRVLYFINHDGQYWVALRPICEVLKVDYTWQLKLVKKHRLYRDVYANQTMHDSKNRLQQMVALPEKYLYLWLAQLPIKTDEHQAYVMEVVNVLFDYFRGGIGDRRELIEEKALALEEAKQLQRQLANNKMFAQLAEVEERISRCNKHLRELDQKLMSQQLNLFGDEQQ